MFFTTQLLILAANSATGNEPSFRQHLSTPRAYKSWMLQLNIYLISCHAPVEVSFCFCCSQYQWLISTMAKCHTDRSQDSTVTVGKSCELSPLFFFTFSVHYSTDRNLLLFQVTTLVNTSNKGPSSKKKGRSKKAHVLAVSVEQATQNFLEKGEQIAKDSQDLKEELIAAVEDVRKQGELVYCFYANTMLRLLKKYCFDIGRCAAVRHQT